MSLARRFLIAFLILGLLGSAALAIRSAHPTQPLRGGVVLAEDDDEAENGERDVAQERETEADSVPAQKAAPKETAPAPAIRTTIQYRPVTRSVVVTEPGYATDSDGDGLVDALDPDPGRHQREYFTDSDGDGIADAFDRYPNEDDFAYVEGESDENGNGLIDAAEEL